jgi:hypothetical protein
METNDALSLQNGILRSLYAARNRQSLISKNITATLSSYNTSTSVMGDVNNELHGAESVL